MELVGAKYRVKDLWRWRSLKPLLLIAGVITIVVSLFEIKLDLVAMAREVASNFVTCVSITLVAATMETTFGLFGTRRSGRQTVLMLFLLAMAGVLGGLLAWGINYLLFSVHMSHPHIYLLMVAARRKRGSDAEAPSPQDGGRARGAPGQGQPALFVQYPELDCQPDSRRSRESGRSCAADV